MKKEENKIGYKISKIQTVKFEFKEVDQNIVDEIFKENTPVKINLNFNINIDKEKSEITIDVNTILPEDSNNNYVIHSGRTSFKVLNIEEFYDNENKKFSFPDNFLIQLLGLSFSHCRALLSVELSRTNFKDQYFLPVVNPNELFSKLFNK